MRYVMPTQNLTSFGSVAIAFVDRHSFCVGKNKFNSIS